MNPSSRLDDLLNSEDNAAARLPTVEALARIPRFMSGFASLSVRFGRIVDAGLEDEAFALALWGMARIVRLMRSPSLQRGMAAAVRRRRGWLEASGWQKLVDLAVYEDPTTSRKVRAETLGRLSEVPDMKADVAIVQLLRWVEPGKADNNDARRDEASIAELLAAADAALADHGPEWDGERLAVLQVRAGLLLQDASFATVLGVDTESVLEATRALAAAWGALDDEAFAVAALGPLMLASNRATELEAQIVPLMARLAATTSDERRYALETRLRDLLINALRVQRRLGAAIRVVFDGFGRNQVAGTIRGIAPLVAEGVALYRDAGRPHEALRLLASVRDGVVNRGGTADSVEKKGLFGDLELIRSALAFDLGEEAYLAAEAAVRAGDNA